MFRVFVVQVTDPAIKRILNPAAKERILVMQIPNGTWSGGQLDWNGVPLTPSVWPNQGLGYVKRVNDVGAIWAEGRTKGPRPHCQVCLGNNKSTASAPCGGNISLAELPRGDWAAELNAGAGFGNAKLSGYLAYDWYFESHPIVRVFTMGNVTSCQFGDTSRCKG